MSIKFSIKNTLSKAEKEGDTILRYSGVSEPFERVSERLAQKVGVNQDGTSRLKFTTGLEENQVSFYRWYSEEDRKVLIDSIKELRPIIENFYGGEETVSSSNQFFWKENRTVSRLSLTNSIIDTFFDTDNPAHALLYLSIASGAFIELVAPTKDWAERHQLPHYMALEFEANEITDDDDEIRKSDAHAALGDLRKNYGKEALYILAWCIQYDTNAFGAINNSTTEKDLINNHIKYIDGKLVTKKKKNTPKVFLDYYEKWIGQQTKPLLFVEAYVKAGEYFSYINQREKKYVTSDGTILGNTIEEAVKSLMKPKFTQDLEKLREQVEKKWNE